MRILICVALVLFNQITCAAFDDACRRLLTGDHKGRVKVWNFSNGACIKVLEKPLDPSSRFEVTAVTCFVREDQRYIAASSWDRKMTIWRDFSEDNGAVYPYMQLQVLLSLSPRFHPSLGGNFLFRLLNLDPCKL